MLKNIIFDLGNTVVRFDPFEIAHHFYSDEKNSEAFVNTVFARKYWDRLDDGSLRHKGLEHHAVQKGKFSAIMR